MRSGNFFLQILQSRFTLIRCLTFFDFAGILLAPPTLFSVRQFFVFVLCFFRIFKGRSSSSLVFISGSFLIHRSPANQKVIIVPFYTGQIKSNRGSEKHTTITDLSIRPNPDGRINRKRNGRINDETAK